MKRFSITSLFIILALFTGAASALASSHGNAVPGGSTGVTTPSGGGLVDSGQTNQTGVGIQGGANVSDVGHSPVISDPAAEGTPLSAPPNPDLGDGFGRVMTWIMTLFAWLVGVAAITLDYAVYFTVVTMGEYVNNLSAVGVTWQIMRDIGNIIIIFGFLAIGISIILNTERLGYGKKMLPMLLVSAVFLNFSLFISEAVIDTGNLFATQFYTQIKGGTVPSRVSLSQTNIKNEGISNKIMGQLGLQTIYNAGRVNTEVFKAGNTWVVGFMAVILFLITAFVMFSLAFMLIARFVILLLLIIIAPIGFAGLAVPKLAGAAGQWWDELFKQTITAPVLLLLLYVALAVITDASFLTGICTGSGGAADCTKNWAGFVEGNDLTGFASMMLSFLVAMGLLLAVVILSKRLSAFGGGWATKWGGRLSFGATAFALRGTAGLGFQSASQAIRRKYGGTKIGRVLATTLDKGAKGSFDVRGATTFGGLKRIGVDAGEAQEGGYRARREKAVREHQEYMRSVVDAIGEGGETKAEKKATAEAVARRKEAEDGVLATKSELEAAAKDSAAREAEVARLKAKGQHNQQDINDLKAAQQNLETSKIKLNAADLKQKTAIEQLKDAKKAEEDSGKAVDKRKRDAQLAYAENIKGPLFGSSVPGWAMFGPGASVAAKKIIKEAGKTNEQRDMDALMNLLKKNANPVRPPEGETPKP